MAGAMSYNARENAPTVVAAAVDSLIQTLKTETRPAYVVDDLRALGNSGDSKAAEVALQYVTNDNAMIRAAAAQAARRTNTPQGADVLVHLIADQNTSVRSSALDAALYSQPATPLLSAVEQSARLDSQDTVRREAIRVLVQWQLQEPSVRDTLLWVSTNDPNDKVRAVAREGLHRFD
jgi:HEAT repeat protein